MNDLGADYIYSGSQPIEFMLISQQEWHLKENTQIGIKCILSNVICREIYTTKTNYFSAEII